MDGSDAPDWPKVPMLIWPFLTELQVCLRQPCTYALVNGIELCDLYAAGERDNSVHALCKNIKYVTMPTRDTLLRHFRKMMLYA